MMLTLNKLNGVETKVAKLLESDITLKEVSEGTGISESILKKLSSGEQSISNAKYSTVELLFNYYLEKSDQIDLYNTKEDYLFVKLPKKIRQLIEDIDKAIQEVNQNKQTVDVAVKDIYATGVNGEIYLRKKELEIETIIGLGRDESTYPVSAVEPYHLVIRTLISETVDHINNFKIIFDKQKLIQTLKQIKHEGGSIGINKSGYENTKNISVKPKNTTIPKYQKYNYIGGLELQFMKIEIE